MSARFLTLLLTLFWLGACAPLPYQPAQTQSLAAANGYLEKEVSPGVFVIEVQQQRSFFSFTSQQQLLHELELHWKKRAAEVCPYGYQGQPEVVAPAQAQIEAFRCNVESCPQQHPLISGVAWCHKRYQL